jgi:hypothetical protein
MNIGARNKNLSRRHRDGRCDKCPCCTIHVETAAHVLLCPEAGRVKAFQLGTTALERWLDKADTDPDLMDSIVKWLLLHRETTESLKKSRGKIYSLLLGQCTQVLVDKMKQDTDWVTISESFDPNLLFKLIEKFVLKQSDNQYKTAVLIDS